jgi:transposase
MQIREAQQQHGIQDMIVVVERTGNYHLAPKRAFAKAGFETRVVHPFATKQYRMPADPGIKTDGTDLNAQHRAAVAGFGLCEFELESPYRELQLRARHRRNLVEKAAAMACQIRERQCHYGALRALPFTAPKRPNRQGSRPHHPPGESAHSLRTDADR